MNERLYSTYQVAELLGVPASTVSEWIERGWLTCQRVGDGAARIPEQGLIEFLNRRGIDVEALVSGAAPGQAGADEAAAPEPVGALPAAPADEPAPTPADEPAPAEQPALPDPATQIAEAILRDAVSRRASAIHLEPTAGGLALRLRIDGVLHEKVKFRQRLPRATAPALLERLKSMAGLGSPEARGPREGRFTAPAGGREVAFAVCTVPTGDGEKLVIHVGDRRRPAGELGDLGMPADKLEQVRALLGESAGIILVVAAGHRQRTSVLQAMVTAVDRRERNVVAVVGSDWPEIEGASVSEVEPAAGYGFAEAVGAWAKQDADVAVVEEVADSRTAVAVVEFAATGRMVLAGLAGRSGATGLGGFCDLCGRPYLLSTAFLAVIEPRIVRRLCDDCKAPAAGASEVLSRLGLGDVSAPVFSAVGCGKCGETGYVGTMTLPAVIEVEGALARAIRMGGDAQALERAVRSAGVGPLGKVVRDALAAGTTSPEEVARVLPRRRLAAGAP